MVDREILWTDNCGEIPRWYLNSVEAPPPSQADAAAPTLSVRTVTPVAQRQTQNENTQEWFSTEPKKGQRV